MQVTEFQVETEPYFSQKLFIQCFQQNVRLFNIFRDPVMLKRKSVVLLLPVYAVRTRTSSGSYQNQYGANDWSRHDKYFPKEPENEKMLALS